MSKQIIVNLVLQIIIITGFGANCTYFKIMSNAFLNYW